MKSKLFLFLIAAALISCTKQKTGPYIVDKTDIKPGHQMENSPDWYKQAVFYHIWVKAFSDGDYKDNIGDLRGIINKLDYIEDLGITAIWLSPIFQCDYKGSNMHGYDIADYYAINERFGTKEDLAELLDKAHERGIRIIMDFVPNHTSSKNKWFTEHPEWYVWEKSAVKGWGIPWGGGFPENVWRFYKKGRYYYSAFSNDGMADLNYMYKAPDGTYPVRQEMDKAITYWLDRGFDGVRMDAVRYLVENGPKNAADQPENHDIFKDWRRLLDSYSDPNNTHPRPDGDKKKTAGKMMVAEAWTDEQAVIKYYGNGTDEFNMCFDFAYQDKTSQAIDMESADAIVGYWDSIKESYPKGARGASFESNHDNAYSRPATAYNGDKGKMILSASLNILGPETPFIYYGNELGMKAQKGNDALLRLFMEWENVDTLKKDENSILNWNRYLITARKKYPSLSGDLTGVSASDDGVMVVVKSAGDERTIVVTNMSKEKKSVTADLASTDLSENAKLAAIVGDLKGETSLKGKILTIKELPPYATRIIYAGGKKYPSDAIHGDLKL